MKRGWKKLKHFKRPIPLTLYLFLYFILPNNMTSSFLRSTRNLSSVHSGSGSGCGPLRSSSDPGRGESVLRSLLEPWSDCCKYPLRVSHWAAIIAPGGRCGLFCFFKSKSSRSKSWWTSVNFFFFLIIIIPSLLGVVRAHRSASPRASSALFLTPGPSPPSRRSSSKNRPAAGARGSARLGSLWVRAQS